MLRPALWRQSTRTQVGEERSMRRVCVFDVNETLLGLRGLDPAFEQSFGDPDVRWEWFSQLLQSAFTATIIGTYHPFGGIAAAALDMTAARREVRLTEEVRHRILRGVRRVPGQHGVADALGPLRYGCLRLEALANATQEGPEAASPHV